LYKIPKLKLMKYLAFFALSALVAFSSCQKDDNPGDSCAGMEVIWNNPTPKGNNNWLWLSNENGEILEAIEANNQRRYRFSTTACAEQYNLSFLREYRRPTQVGNQILEITVYELETYLNIPAGLLFDTAVTAAPLRAIAIEGIQSLEYLSWPAESQGPFSRDLFIDPAANLLSFQIPVPDGQPAFLSIRANGETTARGIWVDAATQNNYSFSYLSLPLLQAQGPVILPNNGNWRYSVRGLGASGSTVLDYSTMPDLVSGQFGAVLPPFSAVRAFQLLAWEVGFRDGFGFMPIYYKKQVNSLPTAIFGPTVDFAVERPERDRISVSVTQGEAQVFQVQFRDDAASAGTGTRLEWSIFGPPEALANLALPQWPTVALKGIRNGFLDENRRTPLVVTAKSYDSKAPYRQFLEAVARRDADWEASQGLLGRSKVE
jgi:hypothetical protein